MKSIALAQAAAKRLATSGRLLMKSRVSAQPAAKASALRIAEHVFGDHAGLERRGDAELAASSMAFGSSV